MTQVLSTALAVEHRAGLLRAAEARRLAAVATAGRRSPLGRLADRADGLGVRLRRRVASAAQPATSLCCT
jgi:hypothetical protein